MLHKQFMTTEVGHLKHLKHKNTYEINKYSPKPNI